MKLPIFKIINQMKKAKIYFELGNIRENTVLITAFVPGQRWEIEVMEDGEIQVEIYKSEGDIYGEEMLQTLFNEFSDKSM